MINASDACGDDVPFESNIFGGLGFLVLYLERERKLFGWAPAWLKWLYTMDIGKYVNEFTERKEP